MYWLAASSRSVIIVLPRCARHQAVRRLLIGDTGLLFVAVLPAPLAGLAPEDPLRRHPRLKLARTMPDLAFRKCESPLRHLERSHSPAAVRPVAIRVEIV